MKRFFLIICICLATLLVYVFIFPMFLPKPNYVIGFPDEKSEGRTELLLQRGIKQASTIIEREHDEINIAHPILANDMMSTSYKTIIYDAIDEHYEPIFGLENDGKQMNQLNNTLINQFSNHINQALKKGYPEIEIEGKRTISITTDSHAERFNVADLLGDYGRKGDEYFTLHVQKANQDAFF